MTLPHIYKLTLTQDTDHFKAGMIYIGQTMGLKKNYFSSGVLPTRIAKKYGRDVFNKEIITEGKYNKELLDQLERHYIQLHASHVRGLNLAKGGHPTGYPTKWVYQYNLDGTYLRSFINAAEASKVTGINRSSIQYSASGKVIMGRGYLWSYVKVDSLPPYKRTANPKCEVHQYDKTTLKYIKSFPTGREAAKSSGVTAATISKCIRNAPNCKTCGGFRWSKVKSDFLRNPKPIHAPNEKPVIMTADGQDTIFKSAAEASRYIGKHAGYVAQVITKQGGTCSNLTFKYAA